MRKRLKISNILAILLVTIMALLTINTVQSKLNTGSDASSESSGSTNAENEEGISEDDIDYDAVDDAYYIFKKTDYLKAYNMASDLLIEGLGYEAIMTGSLEIKASKLDLPTQKFKITKNKYSDGNMIYFTETRGTANINVDSIYNASNKMCYIREVVVSKPDSKPKIDRYTEKEVLDRDGYPFGKLPLIVNESTVKSVSGPTIHSTKKRTDKNQPIYNFTFKVTLDPLHSVWDGGEYGYRNQIRTNGVDYAKDEFPVFKSVVVTFTVNSLGEFTKISYDMVYTMIEKITPFGVTATCTYKSDEIFSKVNQYRGPNEYSYPSWAR